MFMAWNLVERGTLSTDQSFDAPDPRPSLRREPLYPFILAGFLALHDRAELKQHGPACYLEDGRCPEIIRYMKVPNILLHLLLIAATGWAVYVFTRRTGFAAAGSGMIALYTGFISESNFFYPETLAALLFLLMSTLMYLAFFGRRKWLAALGCGLAFGFMILTKAAFFYFLVVCVIVFPFLCFILALSPAGRGLK